MHIINTYMHHRQIFRHNSNGADKIRPVYFYLSAAIPAGTAAETLYNYRVTYHLVAAMIMFMAMFTAAATAFAALPLMVMMLLFTA